eukprot:12320165-Ditylum_brightwellii.AAC.1
MMQISLRILHRVQYQDYINNVLKRITNEENEQDNKYFKSYGTNVNKADHTEQLRKDLLFLTIDVEKT